LTEFERQLREIKEDSEHLRQELQTSEKKYQVCGLTGNLVFLSADGATLWQGSMQY